MEWMPPPGWGSRVGRVVYRHRHRRWARVRPHGLAWLVVAFVVLSFMFFLRPVACFAFRCVSLYRNTEQKSTDFFREEGVARSGEFPLGRCPGPRVLPSGEWAQVDGRGWRVCAGRSPRCSLANKNRPRVGVGGWSTRGFEWVKATLFLPNLLRRRGGRGSGRIWGCGGCRCAGRGRRSSRSSRSRCLRGGSGGVPFRFRGGSWS
jgi:hypothetical protein